MRLLIMICMQAMEDNLITIMQIGVDQAEALLLIEERQAEVAQEEVQFPIGVHQVEVFQVEESHQGEEYLEEHLDLDKDLARCQ